VRPRSKVFGPTSDSRRFSTTVPRSRGGARRGGVRAAESIPAAIGAALSLDGKSPVGAGDWTPTGV
jgi:hypothetical protein